MAGQFTTYERFRNAASLPMHKAEGFLGKAVSFVTAPMRWAGNTAVKSGKHGVNAAGHTLAGGAGIMSGLMTPFKNKKVAIVGGVIAGVAALGGLAYHLRSNRKAESKAELAAMAEEPMVEAAPVETAEQQQSSYWRNRVRGGAEIGAAQPAMTVGNAQDMGVVR
jgi:uncharacterized membrane protein YebE (DUF533 family)